CALRPLVLSTTPSPTEIPTLSLHDALPISSCAPESSRTSTATRVESPMRSGCAASSRRSSAMRTGTRCTTLIQLPVAFCAGSSRSEEHTSELQSHLNLVCRLLLEKKNEATL